MRDSPPPEATDDYDEEPHFELLDGGDKDEYYATLENDLGTVSLIHPNANGEHRQKILHVVTTAEMLHRPEPAWTVDGLVPEIGFTLLVGRNQVGKTFLGLDLAGSISLGRPWLVRETKQTRVLYVALEGIDSARIEAWQSHHSVDGLPDLVWIDDAIDLNKRGYQDRLIALAREFDVGLVVVDTLNRSVSDFDENGSKDMGAIIGFADRLRHEAGAGLTGIHHTPRDGSNPRGHTSLEDAADTIFLVTGTTNPRHLKVTKQRNARAGTAFGFRIVQHPTGGALATPVGPGTELDQLTGKQRELVQGLVQNPSSLPSTHKDLKELAMSALDIGKSTFDDALKGLVTKGILAKEGEGKGTLYVWTDAGEKLAADIGRGDGPTQVQ
jgi:hypothetical protein